MSETVYDVVVRYKTNGSLEPAHTAASKLDDKVKTVGKSFGSLGSTIGSVASSASSLFTGLVEKSAAVAENMAKIGVAAAGAGVLYATHLNSELEKTQISLAAIFGSGGFSSNMTEGMGMASNLMGQMRKDAAALPGETADLVNIFRTTAIPAFHAGMDPETLERFSAKTMAMGATSGLPMDQVAREMGMLLEGRAGQHNVLGLRLGFSGDRAKTFNAETSADRAKDINKELDKFEPAIKVFNSSWDAIWSTSVDSSKLLLTTMTTGLFSRMKDTLQAANLWFDDHRKQVLIFAEVVGDRISSAFEFAKHEIVTWWPAVKTFADNAYKEIVSVWTRIEPYVERFGAALKKAMNDPATFGKIEHILELYAAIKLGAPVLGAAGQMASGVGGLGRAIGGMFAASSPATAAAAGSSEVGVTALLGGSGAMAGGLVAAGALAAALFAGWGAMDILADKTDAYHNRAIQALSRTDDAMHVTASIIEERFNVALERMRPVADRAGMAALYLIEKAAQASELAARNSDLVVAGFGGLNPALAGLATWFEVLTVKAEKLNATEKPELKEQDLEYLLPHSLKAFDGKDGPKAKPGAGGGAGGTNIQKVEIVVSSNQDPSRIARALVDRFAYAVRNPKSSPFARNFSSAP